MSFILDALKKSETERQQQAAPGIADVPASQPRQVTSRWLPAGIILLAVNLIAILVVLLRPAPPPAPTATVAAEEIAPVEVAQMSSQTTPIPEPAASTAERVEPEDRTRTTSQPVTTSADDKQSAEPAEATAEVPMVAVNTVTAEEVRTEDPVPTRSTDTYLTINDLRASGSFNVPDMHIDLHVFSNEPAERFVFINMNQYRENTTTEEGPRVLEITTEGVILDYQGSTFLLPRE